MVDIFPATGLDVLLCFPVSLILLDSDINTYSTRRGRGIDPESTEHGVVEVAGILGSSSSSDTRGGIVLAFILVFLSIAAENTSDSRNNDGKIAHGQGDTGLKGAEDSLPSAGKANDQDGVDETNNGGGQRAGEDGNQTEADGGGDANISENPEWSNDQQNVREGFS